MRAPLVVSYNMKNKPNGVPRAIVEKKVVINKQYVRHNMAILGDRQTVIRMIIYLKGNPSTQHILDNDENAWGSLDGYP